MKVFVFTGPTLPPQTAQQHWDVPIFLPPVAQGDLYKAARGKPWGIGIIDGYFESTPAVWHKEILWALSRGIHVYGSASMGALRAAELAVFGMVGVGEIFKDYASQVIEDDDEVTLTHAPAGRNYQPASEAMINIRHTVAKAVREGVLSAATAKCLADIGKDLFYPCRTYEKILEEGLRRQLPAAELQALSTWLPAGKVDQKRLDAIAMLSRMREDIRLYPQRKKVDFSFARTDCWCEAQRELTAVRRQKRK
ncbi:MAG TPA: TfuA-like protein [Candidatus Nitrosotalea sp.]|nr:TfuA-like protein [Candidatus Nitrosotalea sp.]